MAANEVHLNDIGTMFEMTMKDGDDIVDISSATVKEILFKKPTKPFATTVTKPASFKTNGADGILYYISIADDLDTLGVWEIQARVTLPTGTWSSDTSKFKVYPNLD